MEIDGNTVLMAVAVLGNAGVIASAVYRAGGIVAPLDTTLKHMGTRVDRLESDQQDLYDRKVDREACRERHPV